MGTSGLVFLLAVLTIGTTPATPQPHHPHGTITVAIPKAHYYVQEASELAMLADLNALRKSRGLPALEYDPRLCAVARAHAQDMLERGYFGHVSPEGKTPADRLAAAHIEYHTAGENISLQTHTVGTGAPSSSDDERTAQQGLYDSLPHRENMLSTKFHKVGIGAVSSSVYATSFVQLFSD